MSVKLLNAIGAVYSNNSQDVISADVPLSLKVSIAAIKRQKHLLQNLAIAIKSNARVYIEFESFSDPERAVKYLRGDKSECGRLFREFISKHGHRGLNELSMSGVPYIHDHEQVVSIIMASVIC